MPKINDPQLYSSGYERNRLDRYWTAPWMVYELCIQTEKFTNLLSANPVWECAAGRGDMTRALFHWQGGGYDVYSTDIDMSEFDYAIGPGHEKSFLEETEVPEYHGRKCRGIITNPPYSSPHRGIADDFVEHALSFIEEGEIEYAAMLLRSEFKSGKSKRRRAKFGDCPYYLAEIVLTTRPRWDYGKPDAPENAAPRHNFSWFIWHTGKAYYSHSPIQLFSYMLKGFKP